MKKQSFLGVGLLLLTTFLWGSSFPVLKMIMVNVDEFTYTWLRGLMAVVFLVPYMIFKLKKGGLDKNVLKGGLLAGIAYTLGLWLQGWGTRYTTASNSAFITGVHMVFVHLYVALISRRYQKRLGLGLILAIVGVYMLTKPSTGFNIGDFLVLLGSLAWAGQVILVDKYSKGDPFQLVFAQFLVSLTFIFPDIIDGGIDPVSYSDFSKIVYLSLVAGIGAFTFQVLGQRYIGPAGSVLIFQMEPVFAAILSFIVLGETMNTVQIIGSGIILLSIFTVSKEDIKV